PAPPRARALSLHDALPIFRGGAALGIGYADLSGLAAIPHTVLDLHSYFNGQPGAGYDATTDNWYPSSEDAHVVAGARLPVEVARSEEHTSELQSRRDLVCR